MTGERRQGRESWRDADDVVAAYAGTPAGLPAFIHAANALRRSLDSRLWLLCPSDAPVDSSFVEGVLVYPGAASNRVAEAPARGDALRVIERLAECRATVAFVFAESGFAPYVPAYLCYLAGISYRAGAEVEFAGAVLSPAVRLPPLRDDGERHLALLQAFGVVPVNRGPSPRPTKTIGSVGCAQ